MSTKRRTFLQQVALAGAAAQTPPASPPPAPSGALPDLAFPRTFTGRHLPPSRFRWAASAPAASAWADAASFATGKSSTGPTKATRRPTRSPPSGRRPATASPSRACSNRASCRPTKARAASAPTTRPGSRAWRPPRFTGEFPLARIDFDDAALPVRVSLEAFSPFIPHDAGRFRPARRHPALSRHQSRRSGAKVSIAWSIDNPTGRTPAADTRVNEHRTSGATGGPLHEQSRAARRRPAEGQFRSGRHRARRRPRHVSARLAARAAGGIRPCSSGTISPPMANSGPSRRRATASARSACGRTIAPGAHARLHVPAGLAFSQSHAAPLRLDTRPRATRMSSSAITTPRASRTPGQPPNMPPRICPRSKRKTRRFAAALRESTFPAPSRTPPAPISPRWSRTTCFRTADGEFHGFEGANDQSRLLPRQLHARLELRDRHRASVSRLSRVRCAKPAFGYSMDEAGAHALPPAPAATAKTASGFAAADGQMGQIMHAYLDWRLSGDTEWLRGLWPRVKQAPSSSPGSPGGWDANRDGVMEGVQHNTYDVEFYGPNPLCGIYYLGALRAGEEMARAVGDDASAAEYRRLFESGSQWIDANLFNGEYYIQKIRGMSEGPDRAGPAQRHGLGRYRESANTRWAKAAWWTSCRPVPGRCRRAGTAGRRRTTSARRLHPSIATTTSAPCRARHACSAPSR